MSKVSLAGNASGTGIFTIASPNSNTDRTLTLPDNTGTFLTSAAQSIPKSALPTGSILQVVTATSTTSVSVSSTTFTSIGLSASITPTSSSSKILVMVSYPWNTDAGGTIRIIGGAQIRRGSTVIQEQVTGTLGTEFGAVTATSFRWRYNSHMVDSPATTSSTTYSVFCSGEGTYAITYMNVGIPGIITLMEIAA